MRERINQIVRRAEKGDQRSQFYDVFISAVALLSVVPLLFKAQTPLLAKIDTATVYILFMDYIMLWMTYDLRSSRKGWRAFVRYPFTPFALIDLLSLLPSLGLLGPTWRILRMLRLIRPLHYSKNFQYVSNVIKNQRATLGSVLMIAVAYIFISALAMFVHEPDTFDNFFHAMYWATTALTTVGYGDVYPLTQMGRFISMVSSLFGIAIIALPAGIITGGYIEEMSRAKEEQLILPSDPAPFRLQPLNITDKVKRYTCVMALGALLNFALYTLADRFHLPVWLDMTGTALTALLLDPAAGLIVGLLNNCYLALFRYGNSNLVYYATSAAAALIVGLMLRQNRSARRIAATLCVAVATTTLIAALTELLLTGGVPDTPWELRLYMLAKDAGLPGFLCTLFGCGTLKLLDWLATTAILAALAPMLPRWMKAENR